MTLSATAKNALLDHLGTLITHLGLANGATELTGGSPAYARQPCAWSAAAGGVMALAGPETFDVPAGSTVDRVLLRGHLSNPTPDYGYADVTAEVFGGQGTATVTAGTITASDP